MNSKQLNNKVEDYILGYPKEIQLILKKIRLTILKAAPNAIEQISYGMPFYEYLGKGISGRLIYFAAYKKHISLFITIRNNETIPNEMKVYHVSKATYQFPLNQPFPYHILDKTLKQIIKIRENIETKKKTPKNIKVTSEKDVMKYHSTFPATVQVVCENLFSTISKQLKKSESKVWHGHPVWFLNGNPIVGYSKQSKGIRLMFWSGASFEEEKLVQGNGKFKDASIFYSDIADINNKDLQRWLKKSIDIQWDYKNLVKKKGLLERLK